MATVTCVRCKETRETITGMVYGGKLGDEIRAKVCNACWTEWKAFSIKIINEYRLDLNDPASDKLLEEQMRQFLTMPAEGAMT
jgi:Fe-S cluster biosynthesis and repair protein YggX